MERYLVLSTHRDPNAPNDPNKSTGGPPGILICPSDPQARKMWDSTSYAYSASFYHTPPQINSMTSEQLWDPSKPPPPCYPQMSSSVVYPSRKAMVADWLSSHSDEKVGWWSWDGSRNYLFADGHVRHLRARQIRPAVDAYPDVNLTVDGIAGRDI